MLKKIFSAVLALSIMLVSSVAMAGYYNDYYPRYFNDDRNYILCGGFQGVAIYAIRNSVNVEEYNPPNYTIAIDVGYANIQRGDTTIIRKETRRFVYNWETKEVFYVGNKYLRPIYPNENQFWKGVRLNGLEGLAEITFCIAYNQKFWGTYPEEFYDFMN